MSTLAGRVAIFTVCVCIASSFFSGSALSQAAPRDKWPNVALREENFSAEWWKGASDDEKTGFLYGIIECMNYHLKYNSKTFSYDDEISHISSIIKNSNKKYILVERLAEGDIYRKGPPKRPWAYSEPGALEAWGGGKYEHRRGIIEGYVTCSEHHDQKKLWFNEVDFYVKLFDILYDGDEIYGQDSYSGTIGDILDHYGYEPHNLEILGRKDSYKTLPP